MQYLVRVEVEPSVDDPTGDDAVAPVAYALVLLTPGTAQAILERLDLLEDLRGAQASRPDRAFWEGIEDLFEIHYRTRLVTWLADIPERWKSDPRIRLNWAGDPVRIPGDTLFAPDGPSDTADARLIVPVDCEMMRLRPGFGPSRTRARFTALLSGGSESLETGVFDRTLLEAIAREQPPVLLADSGPRRTGLSSRATTEGSINIDETENDEAASREFLETLFG